jgi:hypothetical protein
MFLLHIASSVVKVLLHNVWVAFADAH